MKPTWIVLVPFLCAACSTEPPPSTSSPANTTMSTTDSDIHSFAKPEEAHVTHVELDLRADFEAKRLTGTAQLRIERRPDAKQIVLDTRDLEIQQVNDLAGNKLAFIMAPPDPILGRALTVFLPEVTPTSWSLSDQSSRRGPQWLDHRERRQKRPYLFRRAAILPRTWIPTRDSPHPHLPARIVVPSDLRAVMSAEQLTPTANLWKTDARSNSAHQLIPPI